MRRSILLPRALVTVNIQVSGYTRMHSIPTSGPESENDAFLRHSNEDRKSQLEVTQLEIRTGEMVTGTMLQIERIVIAVVQNHAPRSRRQMATHCQSLDHPWILL